MVWVHDITPEPAQRLDMRVLDRLEFEPHQPPQKFGYLLNPSLT